MVDEQKLRHLADQLICHSVSRSISEVEAAGEAIKSLLDELQTLREERTAWRVTAENAEKDAARWKWWRKRWSALCTESCARRAGIDLTKTYVKTPEQMDSVTDAAIESLKEAP